MSYLNFKSEYDRFPKTKIKNHKAFHGYDAIYQELNKKINNVSTHLMTHSISRHN